MSLFDEICSFFNTSEPKRLTKAARKVNGKASYLFNRFSALADSIVDLEEEQGFDPSLQDDRRDMFHTTKDEISEFVSNDVKGKASVEEMILLLKLYTAESLDAISDLERELDKVVSTKGATTTNLFKNEIYRKEIIKMFDKVTRGTFEIKTAAAATKHFGSKMIERYGRD